MNWRKIAIRTKSVMAGDTIFESNERGHAIRMNEKSFLYQLWEISNRAK